MATQAGGLGRAMQFDLDHLFSYHSPTEEQVPKYEAIRAAAKFFAKVLLDNTPPSADQAAAMRLLRECVMTANASIALGGSFVGPP